MTFSVAFVIDNKGDTSNVLAGAFTGGTALKFAYTLTKAVAGSIDGAITLRHTNCAFRKNIRLAEITLALIGLAGGVVRTVIFIGAGDILWLAYPRVTGFANGAITVHIADTMTSSIAADQQVL